jgi:hypothetical protein
VRNINQLSQKLAHLIYLDLLPELSTGFYESKVGYRFATRSCKLRPLKDYGGGSIPSTLTDKKLTITQVS